MTPPSNPGTPATPTQATAPTHTRVVVVVPRRELGVHDYLQRSLACLNDVEVVLDRRATAVTTVQDRRRGSSRNAERQLLCCSLVHCLVEAAVTS
ncbi:MAG: hypothetical protein EHM88_08990 [Candidatus Rokuibacteriota bacterium]|nr:MAG: hypothetical protein EHM88_08990 [Candidatus Rokubacteria bacterium]